MIGAQVPLATPVFADRQPMQVPEQSVWQHTPSKQNPERHWFAALQVAPGAPFAVQVVPAQ